MTHICPRRSESSLSPGSKADAWVATDEDDSVSVCSYCGSIHPDEMFAMIANGVLVTPTDKNYKIYVGSKKFYFQHLSEDEKFKFVDLLNAKQVVLDTPGYFYVLPFFVARGPRP